ncbi:MAG: hypothetical protein WA793_01855 [Sphingorhabdus sp.]|uniref:hypothetical protein n=1 Tax=Sphingorhabdus sp. TaxID=1902408 RepID=UPI003C82B96C
MAFLLLAITHLAQAQEAPSSYGEPLETYIDARADYMFGSLGYCSPSGQAQLFKRLDRRWAKVRSALVARSGEDALNKADAVATERFEAQFESVSFAGCKIGDAGANRRNFHAMSARHTMRVSEVERLLKTDKGI